jgi:uncharacterized membrane protein YkvA (DUF1232 family)
MNPIALYQKVLNNPKTRYWVVGLTLIYFFSPIDIIPDFFFPFGYIDDGVLLSMMFGELTKIYLDNRKNK